MSCRSPGHRLGRQRSWARVTLRTDGLGGGVVYGSSPKCNSWLR